MVLFAKGQFALLRNRCSWQTESEIQNKMSKAYKVSYRIYYNDRLKETHFHGKMTHPLYVQVTFDRQPIYFKSYYFDLFSKSRYVIFMGGKMYGPKLDDIKKMETELIEFILDKNLSEFSLDIFKKEYAYYSRDLCDEMENKFLEYLFLFFQDEGMADLATTIQQGAKLRIVYNVVRDMKKALSPALYKKMIENSVYLAPPYLPLFGFMQQTKKWPMLSLSVMEWEKPGTKEAFQTYAQKQYQDQELAEVMQNVENWLQRLKKETAG